MPFKHNGARRTVFRRPATASEAGVSTRAGVKRSGGLSQFITEKCRMAWQKATRYGRRTLAETAVGHYKAIIGLNLRARSLPALSTDEPRHSGAKGLTMSPRWSQLRAVAFVRTRRTMRAERTRGGSSVIDRSSAEPFYLQLGRHLSEMISSGHYASGGRLPSESELCRQFDLSRSTVRESLRALENDGKIRLVQRRGAFVLGDKHPDWMLQSSEGFSENETTRNNRTVNTKVLSVKRGKLPQDACKALQLPEGSAGVIL